MDGTTFVSHKGNPPTWIANKLNSPNPIRRRSGLRRLAEWLATPRWANKKAIRELYREAARRSQYGTRHTVDHIVPLRQPWVCGLHCEDNLQVITEAANRKKGNHWWPDMPEYPADMFEEYMGTPYQLRLKL